VAGERHFISHSPEETQRLGKRLGELAEAGDIFLLVGGLGAGKTCFTQGIAWGLGIVDYTSSPSFVLAKEYHQGRLELYHIDLYRIDNIEEVLDLGLEEYFCRGVSVVEWAERGLGALPEEHLLIKLDYSGENERIFGFEPSGERYLGLMPKLLPKQ